MTPTEKVQLIERIAQDLSGIVPGIGGTHIPVWALVRYRQLGLNDAELLSTYPTPQAENLVNGWGYYCLHSAEIEQEIRENEKT